MEFGQPDDRWWSCQREHFSQWAINQNTYGVKGYRHKPNTNSAKMYNNIRRPELLLWLIEALHISLDMDLSEFKEFVVELTKLEGKPQKQCSKIREKYPYLPNKKKKGMSVDDLFYNSDTTYQSKLKELIEDYFEDNKLFIRFLYESDIISTNIYDDSWYEEADLTKIQEVLDEYEYVFKEQVNKLGEIENSLLECENKLSDILFNFPDGLSEYLKNLGYKEK